MQRLQFKFRCFRLANLQSSGKSLGSLERNRFRFNRPRVRPCRLPVHDEFCGRASQSPLQLPDPGLQNQLFEFRIRHDKNVITDFDADVALSGGYERHPA